ncbi:AraC family transcriptional regulator [Pedobacter sp. MC2016-14]|uniref:AraC family transcriptional regulator n=1 Tax=Pedobacter sp. MC2016-14 TaxID=2897327 RepID=UPI001E38F02C|nr:AraC family transcriptional regulator [Pedobacter sp. MC2016-14]MCD0487251.1 AraC family transcriptional regulator [Pedobacter sp. MC2016-14]
MGDIKRQDGFEGEKYICIPDAAWKRAAKENPIMSQLYITYIGYFPKATYHYRERLKGCEDNILIYCTRGRGWFILNNRRFEVGPNEFIIVPSTKEFMCYGADEKDPWSIYWVHFTGHDMDAFNRGFNIGLYDGAREILYNQKGLDLWESMYKNLELGYSSENLINTNLCLYHFLATFLFPDKHTNEKVQDEKDMIKETIVYMQNNLNEKLSVEEMATKNNLSSSHFSSLFKKSTGMSPLDYFIHLKLQKACVMLYTTETKVKEISLNLGYDDPFHFSRLFKKNMNVSPNQYRNQRRKKEEVA